MIKSSIRKYREKECNDVYHSLKKTLNDPNSQSFRVEITIRLDAVRHFMNGNKILTKLENDVKWVDVLTIPLSQPIWDFNNRLYSRVFTAKQCDDVPGSFEFGDGTISCTQLDKDLILKVLAPEVYANKR